MGFLNIKNERKIVDSLVIVIMALSAYFVGYMVMLDLGALTVSLILPNIFLIGVGFIHLIFRRGRKFDKSEHKLVYEGLKSILYLLMVYISFNTGLSSTKNFIPQNNTMAGLMAALLLTSIYLMGYRPNK